MFLGACRCVIGVRVRVLRGNLHTYPFWKLVCVNLSLKENRVYHSVYGEGTYLPVPDGFPRDNGVCCQNAHIGVGTVEEG